MRSFLTFLLVAALHQCLYSQSYIYGGYGIGHYFSKAPSAENMCTKFNLGWDISFNEDGCIVFFSPGSNNYSIENEMSWGNLPHGFRFGGVLSMQDVIGMQLGMNFMNQTSGGKRTNLTTNTQEEFSLRSRMGLFTMNFVLTKYRAFQPFLGFDLGTSSFRFSYDNGTVNYNNQRMGYNIKLLSANYEPGDKPIIIGFNAGCFVNLVGKGPISLKMAPSYQYILKGSGDINEVLYPDLIFDHSNVSLSFLLTYNFGQ